MLRRTASSIPLTVGIIVLFFPLPVIAQSVGGTTASMQEWFSLLEIPFLAGCVVFAFLTAIALRGGRFGTGMQLLAWGFLVMAIGHIHMQVEMLTGQNIFGTYLGAEGGSIAWMLALLLTWGLSAAGFYHMYRASR